MDCKVVYTSKAQKDLEKLQKEDIQRILKKISGWANSNGPLKQAKKLKGFDINTYRYRVGNYRIIFRIDQETKLLVVLVVLRVLHRKEVYNASI